MDVRPLKIAGAWEFTPRQHHDDRGSFMEMYRSGDLVKLTGTAMNLAQINVSRSRHGVIRGIHYADVPLGQAKYVMCIRGEVRDIVVDLRTKSPTYGQWEDVLLTEDNHRALYIGEGLGHGFVALSDNATVLYVTSTGYDPKKEHTVHAMDPDLAINWCITEPILSERDQIAPSLACAHALGKLPQ